jgi:quinol monooxygenase YgiN
VNRKNTVHTFVKKISSIRRKDMPPEEIVAIGLLTAKSGREGECYKLAKSMSESTNVEDAGCINYVFLKKADNPREFALFERWKDVASVQAHLARLLAVYGPPAKGAPPGSLPKSIVDHFEKIQLFAPFQVVK